ncbi:MAG: alpha-amylase family glycosyl hydrolase [Planctomycetota bacterium]
MLWAAGCTQPAPQALPPDPTWSPTAPPADDAIYFVLVDRYADALPNPGPIDLEDPHAWHGGDVGGVRAHLDELEALGIRTVWLSPIFHTRQEPFGEWGAFHGYWVQDLDDVDPRYGSAAELRALSDGLHARGMRLLLDMVYNHVAFDSPLREAHPDWFHPERPIEDYDDPVQRVEGQVHGLPDLAQERPEVDAWLYERSLAWLRGARADGLRVDAVRHLPAPWLGSVQRRLDAEFAAPVYSLGEIFDGDRRRLLETWAESGLGAAFDYPLYYALVDVFGEDAPVGRLGAALTADAIAPPPGRWVTFLDNHDVPRIASVCGGDLSQVEAALGVLLTARGTPCLTYGTECGLEGEHEPANRSDMRFEEQPLRARIRSLLAARRESQALLEGATSAFLLEPGLLGLLRRADSGAAALILINRRDEAAPLVLPPGFAPDAQPTPDASVPPRATRLVLGRLDAPPAGTRTVVLSEDAGVRAVGSAGLGDWIPERGAARVEVPVGTVLEYKLVRATDSGWSWETRDTNRYLLVAPGTGEQHAPTEEAPQWPD